MLQKKEFKSRPPNAGMTGRPRQRRERSQLARLRLRRQSLPTGLPGPVTRRNPFHPASLWWEVPGPTAARCLPGPTVLNTIVHAVVIGADEVLGQRDATTHQGPATRPDVEGVGSGPGPRLREGPALEPGTLTRRMSCGLVMLQGGRRRSGLPSQPLVFIVIRQGHRIVGPGQNLGIMTNVRVWTAWGLGLHTCPDVRCSCPQQFHRRLSREPSQWSLRLPDQHTRTTRQVWRAWQTWQLWPIRQVWRARQTRQRRTSQQGVRSGWAGDCVRLSNCGLLSTASGSGRWRLSKPTESSRQRLGTSTWPSRGWLGKTTRLGTWGLGKEWRAGSPGYSGRDCASW